MYFSLGLNLLFLILNHQKYPDLEKLFNLANYYSEQKYPIITNNLAEPTPTYSDYSITDFPLTTPPAVTYYST